VLLFIGTIVAFCLSKGKIIQFLVETQTDGKGMMMMMKEKSIEKGCQQNDERSKKRRMIGMEEHN